METVGVSTPVKIQLKALNVAAIHGIGCMLMGGAVLVSDFSLLPVEGLPQSANPYPKPLLNPNL